MSVPLGPESSNITCPHCHKLVATSTRPISNTRTHLLALLMCHICLVPCACCLYCTDCARNTAHYCPSCDAFVGEYKR